MFNFRGVVYCMPRDACQFQALLASIKQAYGVEASVLIAKSLVNIGEANITLETGGNFKKWLNRIVRIMIPGEIRGPRLTSVYIIAIGTALVDLIHITLKPALGLICGTGK